MLENGRVVYIQRDNDWIFAKFDGRHESKFIHRHTLMNSNEYILSLKSNWACAVIFLAIIILKE